MAGNRSGHGGIHCDCLDLGCVIRKCQDARNHMVDRIQFPVISQCYLYYWTVALKCLLGARSKFHKVPRNTTTTHFIFSGSSPACYLAIALVSSVQGKCNVVFKLFPIEIKQSLQISVSEKLTIGFMAFLLPASHLTGSIAVPKKRALRTAIQGGCLRTAAVTYSVAIRFCRECLDPVAQS